MDRQHRERYDIIATRAPVFRARRQIEYDDTRWRVLRAYIWAMSALGRAYWSTRRRAHQALHRGLFLYRACGRAYVVVDKLYIEHHRRVANRHD